MLSGVATSTMAHRVKIIGAGVPSVNGLFLPQSPKEIPLGFARVCKNNAWNVENTWKQLTDLCTPWYLKENGAYIYYNRGDNKWWIDAPEGNGLYIAETQNKKDPSLPSNGWQMLSNIYGPTPTIEFQVI